jgi:hypothetical protein
VGGLRRARRRGIGDGGYYRFETYTAFSQWDGTPQDCSAPGCQDLGTTNGGAVNTSDHDAIQEVDIANAQYGEQFTFQALAPDGSVFGQDTLTYDGADCGCDGCWNWDNQPEFCAGSGGYVLAWAGPQVNFQPTGTWTLNLLDNGSEVIQHTFDLEHNANGPLGISSPAPNQLFDLDQNNYTQTDNVPYIAGTDTGNLISWAATLNYKTSGGYGFTFDTLPGFGTTNMEEQDETYQSEGGQVQVTASTTATDGSTIQDCVTYYIDGPQTGITDGNITTQLESSYPASKYYPSDGTGTKGLMAQVAAKESSYAQFEAPQVCTDPSGGMHPDLWSLDADYGISWAKWPEEPYIYDSNNNCTGTDGGSHIGLMQVMTDSDQSSDPNAWDWTTNAADGVGLFSGTPPAEYGTKVHGKLINPNKMQTATSYETDIMSEFPKGALPSLAGYQLENMALLLYGPGASSDPTEQYYWPTCSGTVDSKDNCSTGWQWNENSSGNQGGTEYVDKVRNESIP